MPGAPPPKRRRKPDRHRDAEQDAIDLAQHRTQYVQVLPGQGPEPDECSIPDRGSEGDRKRDENERLLRAVKFARRFIDAFPVVDKGLLLIGPPGIGKTHIAVAVLRQVVLEKGVRGLYYDTRSLLSTIRSTYNPVTRTSEVDILRPVMEAELLVLDDLGAERPTDWVQSGRFSIVAHIRGGDKTQI